MGTIVETRQGKVEGESRGAHQRFLGIPYAAPPTGELRFRAPRAPAAWAGVRAAHGVRPLRARRTRASCPAWQSGAAERGLPVPERLHAARRRAPAAGAVLDPRRRLHRRVGRRRRSTTAAALAERGDVVVVTINYRLGALGYTAPGRRSTRICGQLDQIAALRWVRDEHRGLRRRPREGHDLRRERGRHGGGDAARHARGARALPRRDRAERRRAPRALARERRARRARAARRARPRRERAREAARRAGAARSSRRSRTCSPRTAAARGLLAFAPALDADTLPRRPLAAVRDGAARDVALLVGTNRDETKLFRLGVATEHRARRGRCSRSACAARLRATRRRRAARGAPDRDLPCARAAAGPRPSRASCSTRSTPTAPSACPRSGSPRRTSAHQPRTFHVLLHLRLARAARNARRVPRARAAVRVRHARRADHGPLRRQGRGGRGALRAHDGRVDRLRAQRRAGTPGPSRPGPPTTSRSARRWSSTAPASSRTPPSTPSAPPGTGSSSTDGTRREGGLAPPVYARLRLAARFACQT